MTTEKNEPRIDAVPAVPATPIDPHLAPALPRTAIIEQEAERIVAGAAVGRNDEATWSRVRLAIEDYLYDQWRIGALTGDKPEQAFFVKCDRTTMTQNDLDDGRLVVLVGVAPVKPAEFVIFKIGQWLPGSGGAPCRTRA